ncbi:glycosyltransferase family 2 protein [Candidatus Woesearchaeota archaeon]|nr:glycosyltransferase family 2 protein [Candidatus Woesearchaeota archaeon]
MEISVVIPAYNEEGRIKKSISAIMKFLENKKLGYEIIVVDDCSKDGTAAIVKGFKSGRLRLVSNSKNSGKGYSVKRGVLMSKKNLVLFSDADLSTPIESLDSFLKYIGDYDIVIGSRRMKGSVIAGRQPLHRRIPGKIFPVLVNLTTLRGIRDTQCGFKLFKRKAAMDIFRKQKIKGFCFDVETLYLAKSAGYKIKEVPVVWNNSAHSKLSPVKDSIRMFIDLIKIRLMH